MKTYVYCQWITSSVDDPSEIYSELDEQRNETRKIEKLRNGKAGYASRTAATPGVTLGIVPVPALEEINASPEFRAKVISQAQFEQEWAAATKQK